MRQRRGRCRVIRKVGASLAAESLSGMSEAFRLFGSDPSLVS